ncbi:hypothetical protein DsansV1_C08g0086251 [Dioscorea sansibarensis]
MCHYLRLVVHVLNLFLIFFGKQELTRSPNKFLYLAPQTFSLAVSASLVSSSIPSKTSFSAVSFQVFSSLLAFSEEIHRRYHGGLPPFDSQGLSFCTTEYSLRNAFQPFGQLVEGDISDLKSQFQIMMNFMMEKLGSNIPSPTNK